MQVLLEKLVNLGIRIPPPLLDDEADAFRRKVILHCFIHEQPDHVLMLVEPDSIVERTQMNIFN